MLQQERAASTLILCLPSHGMPIAVADDRHSVEVFEIEGKICCTTDKIIEFQHIVPV